MKKVILYIVMKVFPKRFWREQSHLVWLGNKVLGSFPGKSEDELMVERPKLVRCYVHLCCRVLEIEEI